MKHFVVLIITAALLAAGCGKSEETLKAEAAEKVASHQKEVEIKRLAGLSPEQRTAEEFRLACEKGKAQFKVCEQKTGNAFVNCLADDMPKVPDGCAEVSLQDLADHAAGTATHHKLGK